MNPLLLFCKIDTLQISGNWSLRVFPFVLNVPCICVCPLFNNYMAHGVLRCSFALYTCGPTKPLFLLENGKSHKYQSKIGDLIHDAQSSTLRCGFAPCMVPVAPTKPRFLFVKTPVIQMRSNRPPLKSDLPRYRLICTIHLWHPRNSSPCWSNACTSNAGSKSTSPSE